MSLFFKLYTVQLLFVTSPLNSSAETTVDYICTTDYPSPIFVELIVNSVVHKVPCGNGSLPISVDDQCTMVTICSRWNSTVGCNLTNCTSVPVAKSCNQGIDLYKCLLFVVFVN